MKVEPKDCHWAALRDSCLVAQLAAELAAESADSRVVLTAGCSAEYLASSLAE